MNMIIAKWGNSLGLRIPSVIAKEAGVGPGCPVRLTARKGRIVIEPVRYDLASLIEGITAKNRHDPVETGAVQGNETW